MSTQSVRPEVKCRCAGTEAGVGGKLRRVLHVTIESHLDSNSNRKYISPASMNAAWGMYVQPDS